MSAALAEARAVTRLFGSFAAVEDVTLDVGAGEIVGLLGANGAGKTTLIRMLLGVLAPSRGSVRLFGEPPSRAARRRLGYVPQGLGIWEDLTVGENLDFFAAAFGSRAIDAPPALAGVRERPAREIGLGRQRQLAFACALGHAPELLVLDEPTSGVDPLARARLWDRVRTEAQRGCGVLVTTHYLEEAHQCDRLVLMVAGRVAAAGTIAEIVAGTGAVRVRCAAWAQAFDALSDAGLPVTLTGRELRVAGTPAERVGEALGAAGIDAELDAIAATLEETMALAQ